MCNDVFFRKGCRPFVEVYNGDKRVHSTAREIEQMRCVLTFLYTFVSCVCRFFLVKKCV